MENRTKKHYLKWITIIVCVIIGLVAIALIPQWIQRKQQADYSKWIENGYALSDERGIKNAANSYAQDVTMIQLIATPEKYHEKLIRVIGVGNLEFEGDYLWFSKEDLIYYTDQRIWLSWGERAIPYEEARAYNGKYVLVEGIFNMCRNGHGTSFLGTIEQVSRYELIGAETESEAFIPRNIE